MAASASLPTLGRRYCATALLAPRPDPCGQPWRSPWLALDSGGARTEELGWPPALRPIGSDALTTGHCHRCRLVLSIVAHHAHSSSVPGLVLSKLSYLSIFKVYTKSGACTTESYRIYNLTLWEWDPSFCPAGRGGSQRGGTKRWQGGWREGLPAEWEGQPWASRPLGLIFGPPAANSMRLSL